MFLLIAFLGCSSKSQDSANSKSPSENQEVPNELEVIDTMEEYISAYCSEYSMRCGGVYESQNECEADITRMWGDRVCEVTDVELLAECIEWLSTFSCEETGWIASCDNFYQCE